MKDFIRHPVFIPFAIVIIAFIFFIASSCSNIPVNTSDCKNEIDSVNAYWMKQAATWPNNNSKIDSLEKENQQLKDLLADSTRFHFIDSTVIHFVDSTLIDTNWITLFRDSVIYHFRDSLRIKDTTITKIVMRDSLNLIDSIVVSLKESYLLHPDSIKVDTSKSDFIPENLIDDSLYTDNVVGKRGTRWAVPGYPHVAYFIFDTTYVITEIDINTWGWNNGYTVEFNVYHYADLILHDSTKAELWSKHKIFYTGNHLYLEILGGKNSWTDIAEIRIYGYKK